MKLTYLPGATPILALVLGSLVALSACFEAPEPDCAFACAQDKSCPDGYRCTTDGWCKRNDLPGRFQCNPASLIDGATVDVMSADAGPDAGPDVGLDAGLDAMP